jgi:hypothetical protein
MISIVVPTVASRKQTLIRCLDAYEATTPGKFELIVVRDLPACGLAWAEGAKRAKGDFIHFTADDLEPRAGWAEAAMETVGRGALPAAAVFNDGIYLDCPVYLQPRYEDTQNILVPFFSRAQFELGGWVLPIHYGTDDWVTYQAVRREIPIEDTREYAFDHTAAAEGRLWMNRMHDVPKLCEYMSLSGYVPNIYGRMGSDFGWAGWVG